jgi:GR25 family glycosyltransferase involved in LPS biosynthesis
MFLESEANECIILEDDFTFRDEHLNFCKKAIKTIISAGDKAKYDVLMLAANTRVSEPCKASYLTRIKFAFTTSGYMINRRFAKTLRDNFKEACEGLERTGHVIPQYCIDVYWRKLQQENIFYALNPIVGYQYANYSDIEQTFTNYGV